MLSFLTGTHQNPHSITYFRAKTVEEGIYSSSPIWTEGAFPLTDLDGQTRYHVRIGTRHVQKLRAKTVYAKADRLGMIPLVGSFIGAARIGAGVHYTAQAIISRMRGKPKGSWKVGLRNTLQGSIELIPIIGSIAMIAFHRLRIFGDKQAIIKQVQFNGKTAGVFIDRHSVMTFPVEKATLAYHKRHRTLPKKDKQLLKFLAQHHRSFSNHHPNTDLLSPDFPKYLDAI